MKSQKPEILTAAVFLARKQGLKHFSRAAVAALAKVGESTVSYHFGNMEELRKEVVQHAVKNEIMPILADARASREYLGIPMTERLKRKVAQHIAR